MRQVLVILSCGLAAGCQTRSRPDTETDPPATSVTASTDAGPELTPASTPAASVALQVVTAAEFRDRLEQYRGSVVLVDMWATW
jgi:hypothetical protein